jgi:hypothetical protein
MSMPATNLVKVVYWAGTTQKEKEVSSYKAAIKVIADEHRNAHDPAFYEISTGRELFDDGTGLAVEDRSYYAV